MALYISLDSFMERKSQIKNHIFPHLLLHHYGVMKTSDTQLYDGTKVKDT